MKLISIFANAIKKQLHLKLKISSIVICCQRLSLVNVSNRKLSCHIWKAWVGPLEPREHTFNDIELRQKSVEIEILLFHEGNITEKCASSNIFALILVFGRVTEVNKSYLDMVSLFTLATLLFESWFGGSPVTVYNIFFSSNKVCKKKSSNKEFNSNI